MRVTMEENARWVYLVLLNILVMVGTAYAGKGIIRCDCTTQECIDAGKTMCVAQKACYTELYENKLTRGCDPNGLACENRRPSGLEDLEWPTLYCCKDRDMCNKHVIPEVPGKTEKNSKTPTFLEEPLPHSDDNDDNTTNDKNGNDDNNNNNNSNNKNNKNPHQHQQQSDSELCPHNHGKSSSSSSSSSSTSSSNPSSVPQPKTKIINPIYIAVPVAGVCVLLALIIFAMYLLRRRTVYHHGHHHHGHHHHENFHHYHHQHDHHVPELSAHPKQTGMPPNHPYQPHHPNHHHCQCVCKKQASSLPACSKSNRCTESERSSSGSETKLFLQT